MKKALVSLLLASLLVVSISCNKMASPTQPASVSTSVHTKDLNCALTSATLNWASDDGGEVFINGNLANVCPNGCWVGVNGISIPIAWINASGDNVLAAYTYATDTLFSATSWQLILTYSNCANTYVEPGPCVLDQYLNDPNTADSGLPVNFPPNWNLVGFNDATWSAPGTIGPVPVTYPEDETIPNPLGGGVSWLWGATNWDTVAVGDGYMYREHFQTGSTACGAFTPSVTPSGTPTGTLTPTLTGTFTPTPTTSSTETPTFTETPEPTDTPTSTFSPTTTQTVCPTENIDGCIKCIDDETNALNAAVKDSIDAGKEVFDLCDKSCEDLPGLAHVACSVGCFDLGIIAAGVDLAVQQNNIFATDALCEARNNCNCSAFNF